MAEHGGGDTAMSTPTLTDVLSQSIRTQLNGMRVCLPGRIEEYSHDNAKANVKPLIKDVRLNGEVITLPVIVNVPVVFPKTKRGGITFPLERGDGVMIIFSDRSLDEWLSRGDDAPYTDSRQHNISDAIAVPGLYSFVDNINAGVDSDSTQLSSDEGKVAINNSGKMAIQSGGNELFQILSDLLQTLSTEPQLASGALYTQYKNQIDAMRQ